MITLFGLIILGASISIDSQNNFVDEDGSILVFHGFNVVYKPFPYYPITDHFDPQTSFSEEDCRILKSLGFNVIRLHIAFEAGMPQRGVLDEQYMLKIREISRMAGRYGIYVLLDAHQDLLSRQFCGEGFPDWAIQKKDFPSPQKLNLRYDDKGYPLIEDCLQQGFANYYMTSDVGRNFEAIYKNQNGVADMLGEFWKKVATLFKDEQNILGYDLLNEPVAGNYQRSKIGFVWPGRGNNKFILPFFKLINKYIREVDTQKLVFFEPYFTDIFGGGFKESLTKEFKHKEVFSYHIYCGVEKWSPWLCKELQSVFMPAKQKNIKHLGTGSMLTEFGALPNKKYAQEVLNDLLGRADDHLQSWTYWQYKGYNDYTTASSMAEEGIFNEDASLQNYKIEALVRPYAYRICSDNVYYMSFDPKSAIFKIKYDKKDGCATQIYIPSKYHYLKGFRSNLKLTSLGDDKYQVIPSKPVVMLVIQKK